VFLKIGLISPSSSDAGVRARRCCFRLSRGLTGIFLDRRGGIAQTQEWLYKPQVSHTENGVGRNDTVVIFSCCGDIGRIGPVGAFNGGGGLADTLESLTNPPFSQVVRTTSYLLRVSFSTSKAER
jgi:hypothetical protein